MASGHNGKIMETALHHVVVTGAAGFIGSHMVERLLALGVRVTGIDNLSTGKINFLGGVMKHPNFIFVLRDLYMENCDDIFHGVDFVFHFSANADVRFGVDQPRKDLEQNTIVTFNVLEAMRKNQVRKIAFSSTGSVYGEAKIFPTPEDAQFPVQTSLYAASKLACEGMIQAYCEGFDFQAWIFRFVSILGERYTHGHVIDFYRKLKNNSLVLDVLGDGTQRKSYLYIQDCISAQLLAVQKTDDAVNIFNLGVDDYCEVKESVAWICNELGVSPQINYAGGRNGWIGDNPFIYLDTKKISALGWAPLLTIKNSVIRTVRYLDANQWLFEGNP